MNISFSSLLTGLLFGSIFMSIIVLILKRKELVGRFHMNFITVCLLLIVLRMTIPIELKGVKSIACTIFLPDLSQFLEVPLGRGNVTFGSLLVLTWGIVAIIKYIVFLISHVRFRKFINRMDKCEEKAIKELLDKVCEEVSHKNRFTVIEVGECQSPFILGLIHPVIILPKLELKNSELEFILRHEVGHYFHYDLWKKYLMELVCIFYWWNPLIASIRNEIDIVLELRRDAAITETLEEDQKIEYLECLLKIAKENNQFKMQKQLLAFCKGITTSSLEQRFDYILENSSGKKKYNKYLCMFICGMLLLLSFSFVFEPYYILDHDEVETFELNDENAYILEKDGQYYVYINGVSAFSIDEIKDSYANLPVYAEEKEE